MPFLITYQCRVFNVSTQTGHVIADDPFEWLLSVQHYEGEENVILNTLEISEEQAKEWKEKLRGM